MARRSRRARSSKAEDGILGTLWQFVEENPQVALALAFEIGALVREATRARGSVKKMLLKQLEKGAGLLPQLVASQNSKVPPALKILAGPALEAVLVARGTRNADRKVRASRKTLRR